MVGGGAYTISGGAFGHLGAGSSCRLVLNGVAITLSGTPAFTAFAVASHASAIELYSTTFSGTATGKRYDVSLNGVISTGNSGATDRPGNAAGTAATGGEYY